MLIIKVKTHLYSFFSLQSLEFWFNHIYTHEGRIISRSHTHTHLFYSYNIVNILSVFVVRHHSGPLPPMGFPSPFSRGMSANV